MTRPWWECRYNGSSKGEVGETAAEDQRNLNANDYIADIVAIWLARECQETRSGPWRVDQNGSCCSHEILKLSKKSARWVTKRFSLALSLTALGQLAQHFFDRQNLTKNFPGKIWKKYLFVQDDLRNTFYFRQFFMLWSFLPTTLENAKLTPKVLGQLAQQSLVP